MSLHRLRTDFQFAVLTLFCVVAIIGVAPFIAYRFWEGRWLVGVIDSLIVGSLGIALLYTWRGGDVRRACMFAVVATTIGCMVVGRMVGLPGAFWSFPVILSNFLLVGTTRGLVASALVILLLVAEGGAFSTGFERLMYLASASVTCLLAFVFARRTDLQREQLQALAARDPLTGIANRRAMEHELHIAAEARRRHGTPVAVAVMDLDHFKSVNDEFGHEAGDGVLVDFVRIIQARIRAGDRLFRYGGEEFVLLLPGTDADALGRLTDELRREVAAQLRIRDRAVTVSIGAAVLHPGEQIGEWLARADAAMYEAKHLGRDRAVVAAPDGAIAAGETPGLP